MTFLALLAAVGATVGNSAAALWEAAGSRRARYGRALWLQPWFLAGLLVDIAAWVLTVVALRFLPVFAVQAILAGAIALTTLADNGWDPWNLTQRELYGVVAVLAGLVLVAGSAAPDRPEQLPPVATPVLLAGFGVLLVLTPVMWRIGRPMLLAALAGLAFGGTSLAARALHLGPLSWSGLGELLADPMLYGLVVMGVLGLLAFAAALRDGAVGPVMAMLLMIEVVVPGLIGLVLLGDRIRTGWVPAVVVGLVLALAGVVLLTLYNPDTKQSGRRARRAR